MAGVGAAGVVTETLAAGEGLPHPPRTSASRTKATSPGNRVLVIFRLTAVRRLGAARRVPRGSAEWSGTGGRDARAPRTSPRRSHVVPRVSAHLIRHYNRNPRSQINP